MAARRPSETAEVLARLPGVAIVGAGVALEFEALDTDEPVDDLRRERANELGVGGERVERRAEAGRQGVAASRVGRADRRRRGEPALDAVEAGVDLRRDVEVRV